MEILSGGELVLLWKIRLYGDSNVCTILGESYCSWKYRKLNSKS